MLEFPSCPIKTTAAVSYLEVNRQVVISLRNNIIFKSSIYTNVINIIILPPGYLL